MRTLVLASTSPFGGGNAAFRTSKGEEKEADTVPFGAFRKTLFSEIGTYDERLVRNQDIELNSRIRSSGRKIIISPEIELKYFNRATLVGLWQQSFNNGLWNPYTIWLTGGGLRLRHFIPMLFVTTFIVLGLCSLFSGICRPLLAGFALLYTFAAYLAAARQGAARNNTSTLLVMICFFTLHFGYGLGSLWGVATIAVRYPTRKSDGVGRPLADRKK
jgi:hypothetical protein